MSIDNNNKPKVVDVIRGIMMSNISDIFTPNTIKFSSYIFGVKIYNKSFVAREIIKFKYGRRDSVTEDIRLLNPNIDNTSLYNGEVDTLTSYLESINLPIINFTLRDADAGMLIPAHVESVVFGFDHDNVREMDIIKNLVHDVSGGRYEPDTDFTYTLTPKIDSKYIMCEKKHIVESAVDYFAKIIFIKHADTVSFGRVICTVSTFTTVYDNPCKYLDNIGLYVINVDTKYDINFRNPRIQDSVILGIRQRYPGIIDHMTIDKFGATVLDAKRFRETFGL